MLETLVKVGTPSFFPWAPPGARGTGGLCSQGAINGFLNGQHKFLPFIPNGINWVATDGQDVLSGPFSGCIMAVYNDHGTTKVCHVSTGDDFGDCKPAWDILKRGYTNVFEFCPSDFIDDMAHDRCYGLITSRLAMYTILTQPKRAEVPGGAIGAADRQFVKITQGRLYLR